MLNAELETAITLARRAGEIILGHYRAGFVTESKLGADNEYEPVTIADREASRVIVDALSEAFPDDGILSEEEPDDKSRLTKKRVWIIDPLDGTAGFVGRNGDFAVQIGLAIDGKAVLGVVLLPETGTIYHAVSGKGAFAEAVSGEIFPLKVSTITDFAEMKLAASRSHRSPKMSRIVERLNLRREIRRGSVGLKIGLLGERLCDLYIHMSPRSKIWDTCAPQVILEEAGGKLTDIFGGEFRYDIRDVQNHNGILASNGKCHSELIDRLKPLLAEFGRRPVHAKNAGLR